VCVSSCRLVGRCHATPGTYTLLDPNPYVCVRTNVRKYMVKLCVNTLSTIIKHHGRKSSNTMVKHHQQPWSNIIKHHSQRLSTTMVDNRQAPWSNIVKNHGRNPFSVIYWRPLIVLALVFFFTLNRSGPGDSSLF
jgi:hypothetical protein